MINKLKSKNFAIIIAVMILSLSLMIPSETVEAGSYDGLDLANAILVNQSTLINSQYTDTDNLGHRQAIVLSSRGTMLPTGGSSFILLTTGVAGYNPATTDGLNPGDERGNWFAAGKYGTPRDQATLTLTLQVPQYMHYIYYDIQFFTLEYPDYIGSQYNDKLTITVDSPSQGTTEYIIDVNGGDYIGPGGFRGIRGYPKKVESSKESHDQEVAKKLWDVSTELTKTKYNFKES